MLVWRGRGPNERPEGNGWFPRPSGRRQSPRAQAARRAVDRRTADPGLGGRSRRPVPSTARAAGRLCTRRRYRHCYCRHHSCSSGRLLLLRSRRRPPCGATERIARWGRRGGRSARHEQREDSQPVSSPGTDRGPGAGPGVGIRCRSHMSTPLGWLGTDRDHSGCAVHILASTTVGAAPGHSLHSFLKKFQIASASHGGISWPPENVQARNGVSAPQPL